MKKVFKNSSLTATFFVRVVLQTENVAVDTSGDCL